MLRLERRASPSRAMAFLSPVVALAATTVIGLLLFAALGVDPGRGLQMFFVEPLRSTRALGELSIKATPLLLIALGLSVCFRANVWNIGAEGQFILGAVFATGVAIRATPASGPGIFVALLLAGAVGGALWAGIVALLRHRFNASETLVSLMLVYVGEQVLSYLVYGPWRDPNGYNFPETITFLDAARAPHLFEGSRADVGLPMALCLVAVCWVFLYRTHAGYKLEVSGLAPLAARYAGYSSRGALWTALLVSGGTAGLAGALEVAGPVGQLTTHVPVGYGFAAIIVAFVGRLNPLGVVFASILMSMFYIGGEMSQSRLGLPKSLTGVFQGLLLFTLLACDAFIHHRVRFAGPAGARPTAGASRRLAASASRPATPKA
jgi:general nucleoside transport system permease protein